MAMSNEQLTAAARALESTIQGINTQLGSIIPKMTEQIDESSALAKTLDATLQHAVNPLVDADLISAMKKAGGQLVKLHEMAFDCDKRLKDIVTKIDQDTVKTQERVDSMSTLKNYAAGANGRVDEFVRDLNDLQHKLKD